MSHLQSKYKSDLGKTHVMSHAPCFSSQHVLLEAQIHATHAAVKKCNVKSLNVMELQGLVCEKGKNKIKKPQGGQLYKPVHFDTGKILYLDLH